MRSYQSNFVEFGNSDNNFAVEPRGFKQTIVGQAHEIDNFEREKVLYNHVVKTIEYSGTGVIVTTTDGVIIQAEYALCTFSYVSSSTNLALLT